MDTLQITPITTTLPVATTTTTQTAPSGTLDGQTVTLSTQPTPSIPQTDTTSAEAPKKSLKDRAANLVSGATHLVGQGLSAFKHSVDRPDTQEKITAAIHTGAKVTQGLPIAANLANKVTGNAIPPAILEKVQQLAGKAQSVEANADNYSAQVMKVLKYISGIIPEPTPTEPMPEAVSTRSLTVTTPVFIQNINKQKLEKGLQLFTTIASTSYDVAKILLEIAIHYHGDTSEYVEKLRQEVAQFAIESQQIVSTT